MKRAVIFDMYETLITFYNAQPYFGAKIAEDAGIPEEEFLPLWRGTESDRTLGKVTLEEVIISILKQCGCYSEEMVDLICKKRVAANEYCYKALHGEILPMLDALKEKGIKIGLVSNCFSEEAKVIRKSILFPYFDSACLSYELGMKKPDHGIFEQCMRDLSVKPEECLYVGDGGSQELEAARELGMTAVQAAWYLKRGTKQPVGRKEGFLRAERPLEILKYLEE